MDDISRTVLRPTLAETGFMWFLRLVALICLISGVFYWIRLVGIYEGLTWRFDLMPIHWQIAVATLAVLFPFTAIGLWLTASWGPVLWFFCAAIETFMYLWRDDLFAYQPGKVIIHACVAAAYVAFRFAIHLRKRRERLRD